MVWPRRLLIALGLALGLSSCAPEWTRPAQNGSFVPPGKVYVCVDLPEKQQAAAELAVAGWDRALHLWKRIVYVEGGSDAAGLLGGPCTYWVHEVTEVNEEDEHILAWASALGGHEISMRKGWYEHDTTGILLHELGHAFGAQHVPGTLMNASWYRHGFTCPDVTTVAQVAAWNRINMAMLCWCY